MREIIPHHDGLSPIVEKTSLDRGHEARARSTHLSSTSTRTTAAASAAEEVRILEPDLCYRALVSRDARFDGRFFVGVTSTGVYCRPICPARTPQRRNVRFYACAAAAEAAGFRACLRCRPEASPGTPAWLGTSTTVSRALRYIAEGALDEGGVDDLAARLGIGERHLRRLFLRHLGVPPLAVAQTQRVHFAKRLIAETTLPMTRIAIDAGFSSIRRFNAAMRKAYSRSPSEIRRGLGAARDQPARAGHLVLRLPFRPPFSWDVLVDFLRLRAIPGVEHVDADAYRRTVAVDGTAATIEVRRPDAAAFLSLHVPIVLADGLFGIVARARRVFDLGADPREITLHLGRDPLLARRIARHAGLRVPGSWDPFETAVRAVVGQQVTVRGATTLIGRIVEAFGAPLPEPAHGGLTRLFPTAARLAAADLTRVGMPRARAEAIRALATAVADGALPLDGALGLERTVAALTRLPGIGPWTAHYIAMRALGEPDAFPDGDLGLRRALVRGRVVGARELAARAEAWRPWRAYAAMYLWTVR
jgi:AraC family transcriptional regulator, regulatory protein of adaptative response / DNA-3-methyladenine glycosylase II